MSATGKPRVLNVIVGTAGHIDHGKSTLVERLTGTHPDRLKEEQERGLTIDIGYAEFRIDDEHQVGIIDVPGHERFVKNMVAGATGIDIVILVVAADDGVMPQTREHMEIMRLLGLSRGLVALTKIDMVDADLLEIVVEDLKDFLRGTFLEGASILPVSSATGEGLDRLAETLRDMIRSVPERDVSGVFRMPVQRSFSVHGHGTVVTGIPVSGRVRTGDELEVLPRGKRVRVRGIQAHHQPAEEASVGQRAALNLSDVNYRDVTRGDVIAAPGFFAPARLIEARFEYLRSFAAPLRNETAVRLHVGTSEALGELVLLDRRTAAPGESPLVQIRLDEDVIVGPGDRFICRLESPMVTLGGGVVLGQTRWRFKRFKDWIRENLEAKEQHLGDRVGYLESVIRSQALTPATRDELQLAMKETEGALEDDLRALVGAGRIREIPKIRGFVHVDMLAHGGGECVEALTALHDEDKFQLGFGLDRIAGRMKKDPGVVDEILKPLVAARRVEILSGPRYRVAGLKGALTAEETQLVGRIEDMFRENLFQTPSPADVAEKLGRAEKKILNLFRFLTERGVLVHLADNVWLHADAMAEARRRVVECIRGKGELVSAEAKDVFGTTRKYVIPLLEKLDAEGLTLRDGNVRRLRNPA